MYEKFIYFVLQSEFGNSNFILNSILVVILGFFEREKEDKGSVLLCQ